MKVFEGGYRILEYQQVPIGGVISEYDRADKLGKHYLIKGANGYNFSLSAFNDFHIEANKQVVYYPNACMYLVKID